MTEEHAEYYLRHSRIAHLDEVLGLQLLKIKWTEEVFNELYPSQKVTFADLSEGDYVRWNMPVPIKNTMVSTTFTAQIFKIKRETREPETAIVVDDDGSFAVEQRGVVAPVVPMAAEVPISAVTFKFPDGGFFVFAGFVGQGDCASLDINAEDFESIETDGDLRRVSFGLMDLQHKFMQHLTRTAFDPEDFFNQMQAMTDRIIPVISDPKWAPAFVPEGQEFQAEGRLKKNNLHTKMIQIASKISFFLHKFHAKIDFHQWQIIIMFFFSRKLFPKFRFRFEGQQTDESSRQMALVDKIMYDKTGSVQAEKLELMSIFDQMLQRMVYLEDNHGKERDEELHRLGAVVKNMLEEPPAYREKLEDIFWTLIATNR